MESELGAVTFTRTWALDISASVLGRVLAVPDAPPLGAPMNASVLLCATVNTEALEWSFDKSLRATKYRAASALVAWK